MSKLRTELKGRVQLITGAGQMGEDEDRNRGFIPIVIDEKRGKPPLGDTKEVARIIKEKDADLLVFCGGDGTARDILDAINTNFHVLGVPTGVKMHSAVFAVDPHAAARMAIRFLWGGSA